MKAKAMMVMMFAAAVTVLTSVPAHAHKVSVFAYVEGNTVYTESYFSDGQPVKGGKILVYDSTHKLLLQGATDQEGLFSFPVPQVVDDLVIVLEASMGHRGRYVLKRSELEG